MASWRGAQLKHRDKFTFLSCGTVDKQTFQRSFHFTHNVIRATFFFLSPSKWLGTFILLCCLCFYPVLWTEILSSVETCKIMFLWYEILHTRSSKHYILVFPIPVYINTVNIIRVIKSSKMRLVRHIACMGILEMRKNCSRKTPMEWPLGRPWHRWEDVTTVKLVEIGFEAVDRIRKERDNGQMAGFVKTGRHFRPLKTRKFLDQKDPTSWN